MKRKTNIVSLCRMGVQQRHIVILTILLLLTEAQQKEMVIPQLGLAAAKHTAILEYHSIIFIPYRIKIDFSNVHMKNETCKEMIDYVHFFERFLHQQEEKFLQKIRNLFPCDFNTHCSRRKRFLGTLIGGIINAAMTGYSLYEQSQLKDAITHLQQQNDYLHEEIQRIKEDNQLMSRIVSNIAISVQQTLSQMQTKILHNLCVTSYDLNALITLMNFEFSQSKIDLIIQSILDNKVNDFLISPSLAKQLIQTQPQLSSTIMAHDLGIFFQTSRSFLLQYDDTHRTLDIILEIPVIPQKNYHTLFKLYNIGFLSATTHLKVKTPPFIIWEDNTVMEVDISLCSKKKFFYICKLHNQARTTHSNCVQRLILHKDTSQCSVTPQLSQTEQFFTYTPSGLLISSRGDIQIMSKYNHIEIVHSQNPNFTHYFLYHTFTKIIANKLVLPTRLSANFNVSQYFLNADFDFNFSLPLQNLQKTVVSIEALQQHEKMYMNSHYNDLHLTYQWSHATVILIGILFIILLVLCIFISILYRRLRGLQPAARQ